MKKEFTYRVVIGFNAIPKIEKMLVVKRTAKQVIFKKDEGTYCETREALISDYAIHFKTEKLAKEYCIDRATSMVKKYSTIIEQCANVVSTYSK